jgi:glycosyltransferase involved in cell wall biosynthesis
VRSRKILHTESSLGWGGQEKRILLEAVSLQEKGHQVLVVGQPDSLIKAEAEKAGVPFRAVRMRTSWDPLALAHILSIIRDFQPDVIHTHSSKDSWLAGLAGRLMKTVVVRTRHVSIPASGHGFNWVYRFPHQTLTTAERISQILVEKGLVDPERVCVLPTGVDLSRFNGKASGNSFREEFGVPEGVPTVGLIANLRKSKGIEHFLAAARILKDEGSSARFFVVGEGHWREIFRDEAGQLGLLDGTVSFTGYREDVPEVMAALDLLVIASTRTEGIPQVALQAMSMGVPVVGTDIGGVPEAILPANSGLVVPPGDPSAMAKAAGELLNNPSRRTQMGDAGKRYVKAHHSLNKMLEDTERIYEKVLATCAN